jgi:hypothetical protein
MDANTNDQPRVNLLKVRASTWHGLSIETSDGETFARATNIPERDRIIQCVNACEGVLLDDASVPWKDERAYMLRTIDELRRERDQYRAMAYPGTGAAKKGGAL